jgi:formylglycine-generating enzyme required for sulfatase activity
MWKTTMNPAAGPAILAAALTLALAAAPAHAQSYKPGDVFRDCPVCPEMVVVPPGIFIMGTSGGNKQEAPARPVRVLKPFAIGKYEITFDEWEACIKEKGCPAELPDDHGWGRGRRPIININHEVAKTYTAWLTKKTGRVYRLPTEAEWEYAARAGTTTDFPWGNEVGENRVNCRQCGSEWSGKGTAPVGSFPPNPFGLYDLNGNVWEWVEDCWNPDHAGAPKDARARLDGDCTFRVMKGGSWYYFGRLARSPYRFKNHAHVKSYNIGLRVVRELP